MKTKSLLANLGVIKWLLLASVVSLIIQLVAPVAYSIATVPKPGELRQYRINSDSPNACVYLPKDYRKRTRWPLVVFLHGSGSRGHDFQMLSHYGGNRLIQGGQHLNMIAVSPQCASGRLWEPDLVNSPVDLLVRRFRVDESQIYLCGFSLGGSGVWEAAAARPDRYAAIVAISGRPRPELVNHLKETPIRIYHGDNDDVVPYSESEKMAAELRQAGASVRFQTLEGVGHGIAVRCLNEPDFFTWLLSNRLQN